MLNRDKNSQMTALTNPCPISLFKHRTPAIAARKKTFRGFLFFAIFLPISASAQRTLNIEEAIANALQKNYDIILSRNDSALAAIDYGYRHAAFLPQLNGNLGTQWNNNSQNQTLFDGSKKERHGLKSNNTSGQLALTWTLFDGLKMFVVRTHAEQALELGELEIKNQVTTTVATV